MRQFLLFVILWNTEGPFDEAVVKIEITAMDPKRETRAPIIPKVFRDATRNQRPIVVDDVNAIAKIVQEVHNLKVSERNIPVDVRYCFTFVSGDGRRVELYASRWGDISFKERSYEPADRAWLARCWDYADAPRRYHPSSARAGESSSPKSSPMPVSSPTAQSVRRPASLVISALILVVVVALVAFNRGR